jgi:hypothetical protein
MDWFQALVLALIQGLTEFLPISSSAHLILPSQILGWPDQGLAFDVAVHLGTLLAVMVYYRRDLVAMVGGAGVAVQQRRMNDDLKLGLLVVLATIPAVVFGFLGDDFIEQELRSRKIPLFSLENKIPLYEFDVIGFSLLYELNYSNILTILDLGRIPLFSRERNLENPLLIAGGPAVFNPEPVNS